LEVQRLPGSRVQKLQLRSVKEVTSRLAVLLRKLRIPALSVDLIADDRMPDRSQVHANLVCATGVDFYLEK
jgi:hypothetical protein